MQLAGCPRMQLRRKSPSPHVEYATQRPLSSRFIPFGQEQRAAFLSLCAARDQGPLLPLGRNDVSAKLQNRIRGKRPAAGRGAAGEGRRPARLRRHEGGRAVVGRLIGEREKQRIGEQWIGAQLVVRPGDRRDRLLEQGTGWIFGVSAESARLEALPQVVRMQLAVGFPDVNPDPPGAVQPLAAQARPVGQLRPEPLAGVFPGRYQPMHKDGPFGQIALVLRCRPDRRVHAGRDRDCACRDVAVPGNPRLPAEQSFKDPVVARLFARPRRGPLVRAYGR